MLLLRSPFSLALLRFASSRPFPTCSFHTHVPRLPAMLSTQYLATYLSLPVSASCLFRVLTCTSDLFVFTCTLCSADCPYPHSESSYCPFLSCACYNPQLLPVLLCLLSFPALSVVMYLYLLCDDISVRPFFVKAPLEACSYMRCL